MRMTFALIAAAVLLLTGCKDKTPSVENIEEGYRNITAHGFAKAVKEFGSEENIPPLLLGMLTMTTEVDSPKCEKNQGDLGFICLYNITLRNSAGVALDPVTDIKARVWQGDAGWMVHEMDDG